MEEADLLILSKYIDEHDYDVKPEDDVRTKEYKGYSGWAIGDIFSIAVEEHFKPPPCVTGYESRSMIDILEEYSFTMDEYYRKSDDSCQHIFAIASDVADDFLRFYIQERGNNANQGNNHNSR